MSKIDQPLLHNGVEAEFYETTGTVVSPTKHSKTYVHGGGGYTTIQGGRGTVVQDPIRSSVRTITEFFIKTDEGVERSVSFEADIPVREGHRVTMISAQPKGHDNGFWSVLVNHDMKQHWYVMEPIELAVYLHKDSYSRTSAWFVGIIFGFIGVMIGWFAESFELLLFGGCGAFLTAYFIMIARLNGRADRVDKKIKAHLNQLANWAYENKAKYMENT